MVTPPSPLQKDEPRVCVLLTSSGKSRQSQQDMIFLCRFCDARGATVISRKNSTPLSVWQRLLVRVERNNTPLHKGDR